MGDQWSCASTIAGPYVGRRILDLTAKAAAKLGMQMYGTAPAYIETVRRETRSAATEPIEYDLR